MKAPFKTLKRTTVYQGRIIRLDREELLVGGQRITRETVRHPGAVVILPRLPDGRLVLVRQYRRAVRQELLELPAGTLHPGEPPRSCARRELEEETGWRPARIRMLCRFFSAPGFTNEVMTLFLAEGLRKTHASPDADEFVRPVVLRLGEAVRMVRTGRIRDAKSIAGILWAVALLDRPAAGIAAPGKFV